jgi:signal transduction histidine kinase
MPIPYVILLTAKAGTADIVTGLNAGANDYIFKPFILEELRARIGVGQRYLDLQDALARRVAELNDLNRVYAVLSNVNQAIIRVQDRQDLFSEVCRIAVEDGRFRMAWIGWLDQERRSLVVKCHHGYSDGYLELLRIDVDSGPFSRGPAGVALKEGTYHVCNDVAHDEEMAPWREEALKREFMSVAAFPVRVNGRVAGVFTLYAGESGFFDGQRIRLLAELAADISFALEGMERERQRQEAEKALHALNLQLEQRVLERTSELESVNRELEAFGYSVSHDLRAPLRHISGFSEVFWDEFGDVLGDTGKAFLEKIQDACRQMTRLIDDLLELSRASRKEMDCHTVDVTALCHDVAHGLIHSEPQRSVTVNIAPAMTVRADRGLLRIVLHNLIDNAWKYTARKDHATIEVGIIDSGGEWVFYVRDDGVGFNMDYTEKIFDAFQRLHSNDEFPGTGIGLATVHRIVSRHGGRVWAEGQPGKGATFYFTIPS